MPEVQMIAKNTRSPAMWEMMKANYDFQGKRVMDLGCGTGDFIWYAYLAGAKWFHGVDIDTSRFDAQNRPPGALLYEWDLDHLVSIYYLFKAYDVAFCFSVLPYLRNFNAALEWMRRMFPVMFIECQYAGDGPGPENIKNDDDMRFILEDHWQTVNNIGFTVAKERFKRTIWMCTNGR